jgi:hypothetical protein
MYRTKPSRTRTGPRSSEHESQHAGADGELDHDIAAPPAKGSPEWNQQMFSLD